MSGRRRKILWALLAVILVTPFATYWLADTWLESSGGRAMLERALGERAGMEVRLTGDFSLMLLPAVGVSGTGLQIGKSGEEFATSREYEISVALKPLLDRQVVIEWIRMTGGRIAPQRFASAGNNGAGRMDPGQIDNKFSLPEINELIFRDFEIELEDAALPEFLIHEFSVNGFAADRETPFVLNVQDLLATRGRFLWDSSRSMLRLVSMQLEVAGQAVEGMGCLVTSPVPLLQLDLRAGKIDLDALQETLAGVKMPTGGADEAGGKALDMRVRLSAKQVLANGIIASGVVLSFGEDPDCG